MSTKIKLPFILAGLIRNVHFPFDIETDTALSVATEMVAELDITDQDVTKIAGMIDGEIASLVPDWKPGWSMEETPRFVSASFCHNCVSNGSSIVSLMDYLSMNDLGTKNGQVLQCHGCAAMHGRFEEITYQVEGSEHCVTEGASTLLSQSDGVGCTDIQAQNQGLELSSHSFGESHSNEDQQQLDQPATSKDEKVIDVDNQIEYNVRNSLNQLPGCCSHFASSGGAVSDDYKNEIRQELRWLKAKYQMELRDLRDRQLEVELASSLSPGFNTKEHRTYSSVTLSSVSTPLQVENKELLLKSAASGKHFTSYFRTNVLKSCPNSETQRARHCEATSLEYTANAKSFYIGALLPHPIHRTTSLPVDVFDDLNL